jgi:hypothetical protein
VHSLQLYRIRHVRGATSVVHPCNDVTPNDAAHKNAAATSVCTTKHPSRPFHSTIEPPTTPSTRNKSHTFTTNLKMAPRSLLTATRSLRSPIQNTRIPFTTRRTFLSTPTLRIKEDAVRSPEQVESAKQEQLKEQEKGEGRWREDLASHGESNIAADRQQVNDHEAHMKELQQEGKEKGEKGEM